MSKKTRNGNDSPGFKLHRTIEGHESIITQIAWSQDGQVLASCYIDGTILRWNTKNWKPDSESEVGDSSNQFYCVACSPKDKQTLASGNSVDSIGNIVGSIDLWDMENGTRQRMPERHTEQVNSLAWSPDGQILASGSSDAKIWLWNPKAESESEKMFSVLKGHENDVYSVAWSSDGKFLASGSHAESTNATIRLWEVTREPRDGVAWKPQDGVTCKLLKTFQVDTNSVRSLAWSPDGKILASGSEDGTIQLLDIQSRKIPRPIRQAHKDTISSVSFSSDGNWFASKSDDGVVQLWRCDTWEKVASRNEKANTRDNMAGLAFHPNHPARLATFGQDTAVRIWDITTVPTYFSIPDSLPWSLVWPVILFLFFLILPIFFPLRVHLIDYKIYEKHIESIAGEGCISKINDEYDDNYSVESQDERQLTRAIICNTDGDTQRINRPSLLLGLLSTTKWPYKWHLRIFAVFCAATWLLAPWSFVWCGNQHHYFTKYFSAWRFSCISLTCCAIFLIRAQEFDLEILKQPTRVNWFIYSLLTSLIAVPLTSLCPWVREAFRTRRLPSGFGGRYYVKLDKRINNPHDMLVVTLGNSDYRVYVLDEEENGKTKLESFHLNNDFTSAKRDGDEIFQDVLDYKLVHWPKSTQVTLVAYNENSTLKKGKGTRGFEFRVVDEKVASSSTKEFLVEYNDTCEIFRVYGNPGEPFLHALCKKIGDDLRVIKFYWDDKTGPKFQDQIPIDISDYWVTSSIKSQRISFVVPQEDAPRIRTQRHAILFEPQGNAFKSSEKNSPNGQSYGSYKVSVDNQSCVVCFYHKEDSEFHIYCDGHNGPMWTKPHHTIYHSMGENYSFTANENRVFLLSSSEMIVLDTPGLFDGYGFIGQRLKKPRNR